MTETLDQFNLENRRLNIREIELKQKKFLETLKIVTTGIVITLLPAIINFQIQGQQIEIKRLEGEINYLEKFSNNVVGQEDIEQRRNFVEYLATIAHSQESRKRWKTYLCLVEKLVLEKKTYDTSISDINKKTANITNQLIDSEKQLSKVNNNKKEIAKIQKSIDTFQKKLLKLDQKRLTKASERQNFIKNSSLGENNIVSEENILSLVAQMNSHNKSSRLFSVAKLINEFNSNELAISTALDYISMPLLETLSPSGKINFLVFLRNTAATSWNNELKELAISSINLIRKRSRDNKTRIGPQTEDALNRLNIFLKKIK